MQWLMNHWSRRYSGVLPGAFRAFNFILGSALFSISGSQGLNNIRFVLRVTFYSCETLYREFEQGSYALV